MERLGGMYKDNLIDHDIWLRELIPEGRTQLMGAFAATLHHHHFSKPDKNNLAASTVQETMANLGEIFRANMGHNPTHGNGSSSFHLSLALQFKGIPPYLCVFTENLTA